MEKSTTGYAPPLVQLLTLGDIRPMTTWPDYLALGLGARHIPDLIRMATDPALNDAPSDSPEVWAPVHAWRTLALLHAGEAAGPLTSLFRRIDENDDDVVGEDLPEAFGVLGPAAIPALGAYLLDGVNGLWARVGAAHSLADIGAHHAEARLACIAALSQALARFSDEDPTFNGFVISFLLELKAVESSDVIQRAYAAEAVDDGVVGDWEDVQVDLGLKTQRDRPRRLTLMQRQVRELMELLPAVTQRRTQPPTTRAEFEARAEQALLASKLRQAGKPKRKRHRKRK